MKIAVIGAGISGLSIGKMLSKRHDVVIYEADSRPGGLIKCDVVKGSLFHRTGGHVFNSKRHDVLDWFWGNFNRDDEFIKATRNAAVSLGDGKFVSYPIENHVYQLDGNIQKSVIADLVEIAKDNGASPENFEEFLMRRFGKTLYDLYFEPYNNKVWKRDLSKVSLSWLEGKLPMPTVHEIIYNNINQIKENKFVHSSFFYPKHNGSQSIADRLAYGLDVRYNVKIENLRRDGVQWFVDGTAFDRLIYCGNIKNIQRLLNDCIDVSAFTSEISKLAYHGTTTVFCEVAKNPYSWVYLPGRSCASHRIICTGNFSEHNNAANKMTATIEFTDEIAMYDILEHLGHMPFLPKYLSHHYEKYTYPIQDKTTRTMLDGLKTILSKNGMYLLGRFAEWEYYNMDAAVGAAIDLDALPDFQ